MLADRFGENAIEIRKQKIKRANIVIEYLNDDDGVYTCKNKTSHFPQRARDLFCEQPASDKKKCFTKKENVLLKALNWCTLWTLKSFCFQKFVSYRHERRQLRLMLAQRLSSQISNDIFLRKFSLEMRIGCIRRLGKLQLSKLYNQWKIKIKSFQVWLNVITKHSSRVPIQH